MGMRLHEICRRYNLTKKEVNAILIKDGTCGYILRLNALAGVNDAQIAVIQKHVCQHKPQAKQKDIEPSQIDKTEPLFLFPQKHKKITLEMVAQKLGLTLNVTHTLFKKAGCNKRCYYYERITNRDLKAVKAYLNNSIDGL